MTCNDCGGVVEWETFQQVPPEQWHTVCSWCGAADSQIETTAWVPTSKIDATDETPEFEPRKRWAQKPRAGKTRAYRPISRAELAVIMDLSLSGPQVVTRLAEMGYIRDRYTVAWKRRRMRDGSGE